MFEETKKENIIIKNSQPNLGDELSLELIELDELEADIGEFSLKS